MDGAAWPPEEPRLGVAAAGTLALGASEGAAVRGRRLHGVDGASVLRGSLVSLCGADESLRRGLTKLIGGSRNAWVGIENASGLCRRQDKHESFRAPEDHRRPEPSSMAGYDRACVSGGPRRACAAVLEAPTAGKACKRLM